MKGNTMKDKITIAIVCAFCIGMYWISRTASISHTDQAFINEDIMPTQLEDSTMDFNDYEVSETKHIDETNSKTEASIIKTCTLNSTDTNALTFSEAFGYYRQCLGSDSSFYWEGNEYTTFISEEIIIEVADSIKVGDNLEASEVSQIR